MKILSVSDVVVDIIHSPLLAKRFGDVDCVLACGDLSLEYMEYIVSVLNKPMYFVYGNHAQHRVMTIDGTVMTEPQGCTNIHKRVVNRNGVLIAGLEGSMRYNNGPHQYSDGEMAREIRCLTPRLWWNKRRYGRGLDILITHAPPLGIHDGEDLCHRGFKPLLRFMDRWKPRYLIHGHTHLYRLDAKRVTQYNETTVINTYGYQIIEIDETTLGGRP
jgi:Icc-related predicted phosphoesterase